MSKSLLVSAVAVALFATSAHASSDKPCTDAPKAQWLTIQQIADRLESQGYKVSEIEFEDSCAEVEVRKDGVKSEFYLDPTTASVVKKEDD